MTKEAALHTFFSSFGIPAYPASAVPEDTVFPWLTYDVITAAFDADPVSITLNLWYYTESEAIPNGKAREISQRIGYSGVLLNCDEGTIWIRRGSPWCQSLQDETDKQIKRRYINITAEYLTFN